MKGATLIISLALHTALACKQKTPVQSATDFIAVRTNHSSCCGEFAKRIGQGDLSGCDKQCGDCIKEETNGKLIYDICWGVGCSSSLWCGIHDDYKKYDCFKCAHHLDEYCAKKNVTLCRRDKRQAPKMQSDTTQEEKGHQQVPYQVRAKQQGDK